MPELDAIIGGHSHTRVDPAEIVNGVLVAQAGSDNRYLGRVELLVRNGRVVEKKGELIDLKGPMAEEDPEVKAMIDRFNQNPAFARVIAEAPFEITGKDALGSLMTDAIRLVHGLDIAFQNNGGIRLEPPAARRSPSRTSIPSTPSATRWCEIAMSAAEIRSPDRATAFEKGSEIDLQVSGHHLRGAHRRRRCRSRRSCCAVPTAAPLPEDGTYQVGLSSYVASSYKFAHQDPGRSLAVHHRRRPDPLPGERRRPGASTATSSGLSGKTPPDAPRQLTDPGD